ncbi:ion transporter [Acidaminobacter hydrogenoformans]|uniref:Voltage-gated potassium channel n=1 Tax=Acidaminobacter hydrogenoformans DSM 2784 TaxID=1120920 RepID=A0A1G5S142_9FIRM|nr:ion transporter [Acidaminobacter hydrogenoformans]SCZ80105.1 voltage-gated potassium channel [Acidaminobacter hydrogenoformans DSM 2784]
MREALKSKLYEIIFEAETPEGKAYDVFLIISIIISSLLIMLESVVSIQMTYGTLLFRLEWFFVILFTLEYFLRLYVVKRRRHYAVSFFGFVDLLSILPAYASIFLPTARFLMLIRVFRLLRLFRIFKMVRYVEESGTLIRALRASRPKITVFLLTIVFIVVLAGALMYIVEGPQYGFDNIPESMYWAIVTVTTVGYGDISPQTPIGKLISSLLMVIAYGIIAVPTGIITSELSAAEKKSVKLATCPHCFSEDHAVDAVYCNKCGGKL